MHFSKSHALFERASRVIPGGIYGHMTPAMTVPGEFPYYVERAEGCRYWDVDGNELIDFMCGYGPVVLGYNHPEVEEAAERQRRKGNCFNHPSPVMVDLAERLTGLVDFAQWCVFGKNGSDMTTWTLQVAREFTGRKKILCIQGAYHGSHAWCSPGHAGIIHEDRAHIHTFPWNDLNAFERLIRQYPDQIAAVILTPFHHPAFGDSVMPLDGFFTSIQETCKRHGILMILDDVRAGFRLHMGGSHRLFGFTPDMIIFCKALGNGYPISAALGSAELKIAASRVFLTGSYWNSAVPMAAAMACLNILERDHVPAYLGKMGDRLMRGFQDAARKQGYELVCSGPPATPFMRLACENSFMLQQRFCASAVQMGVFCHPHHNWFLCAAHKEKDIDHAVAVATRCFVQLRNMPVTTE